jgi:hypothetical protein
MERTRKPKRHFAVLLNGEYYAETWAVSAKKAVNNVWWNFEKDRSPYTYTSLSVDDFDAVEI